MLRSCEYSHSHRARHNVMFFVGRDVGPSVLRASGTFINMTLSLDVYTWPNSSTTATIALTVHLLLLEITILKILLSTMMRYQNHRSLSPILIRRRARYEDTTPPRPLSPSSDDEWYADSRRIRPRQSEDEDNDRRRGSPFSQAKTLHSSPPKSQTCRCGLFTPCRDCRDFLTKESLGLLPPTRSRSQTISEPVSSPVVVSQESDWGQESHALPPAISSSRSLNLDMIGHTSGLLNASKLLAQSTTYPESAMRMADIIFIVSSTSSGSSTSKTCTDSASDHLKMIRAESALSKLIATYCQLRAHPSTFGTTRQNTVMSYPQTASDLVLEDLMSLATTCGQEAWLKQTKHSFLKTLAAILREISSCSTAKFKNSQIHDGAQSLQNYLAWKRMESSSTGNGTRKQDAGSSRTSATPFRVSRQRREDSPTLQRRKKRIDDTVIVDLLSDSDDQSL